MKVTLSTFLSGETGYLNSVSDATAEIAVGAGVGPQAVILCCTVAMNSLNCSLFYQIWCILALKYDI